MRITRILAGILAAGALTLGLVSGAAAQAQRARLQTVPAALLAKLKLTPEQETKVKAAADAYRADADKAAALTDMKEKRAANKAARQKYEADLQAALSDDQKKQLAAFQEEAKQYTGMGALGSQLVGLNLTDDQKSKIKAIQDKYAPGQQQLRDEAKTATDKTATMQKRRALTAKIADEVKAVLTPEQQKELAPARKPKTNP